MKRFLFVLSILFVSFLPMLGQTASVEVERNVNLRPKPNSANVPIELLQPPTKLELITDTKRNGYYNVRAADGSEGWVWAKNVRLLPGEDTSASVIPDTTAATTGVEKHISKTWQKFAPKGSMLHTDAEGDCPPEGDSGDASQYILKNRSNVPPAYHDVTFDAIKELPFVQTNGKYFPANRNNWLPEHFAAINQFESIPLRVEGYIVVIRDQKNSTPGKGEGTNCGFGKLGDIDAHIALVKSAGDSERTAIVVEWTPRLTQIHPGWTSQKLKPWIGTSKKVRISGWLMMDPFHTAHLNTPEHKKAYRDTLWEIHPITEIEVEVNGQFVSLDSVP